MPFPTNKSKGLEQVLFRHIRERHPDIHSIAFIGVAKHSGKTTVMNHVITEAAEAGVQIGLMSIGVDGENKDAIMGVPKPKIVAPVGALVASAKELLQQGTSEMRVLADTGISSPFGNVFISRVESMGTVLLAGVRQVEHVQTVQTCMYEHENGMDICLIDGAFDRMALAQPGVCDGVVIATGAILAPSIQGIIRLTQERIRKFQAPTHDDPTLAQAMNVCKLERTAIIVTSDGTIQRLSQPSIFHSTFELPQHAVALCLGGALTDAFIERILSSRSKPLTICVTDPTKLFVTTEAWIRAERAGHRIVVDSKPLLLAITVNPFDIRGRTIPSKELTTGLQSVAGEIPIFDVMDSDHRW